MSRELLERALRALNNPQDCGYFGALIDDIKSELANPEPEPVADTEKSELAKPEPDVVYRLEPQDTFL